MKPDDAAVTHTFLEAKYKVMRATIAALPAGVADLKALSATVTKCLVGTAGAPHLALGGKRDRASFEVGMEMFLVAAFTLERPIHHAYKRFDRVVERLRWSNHTLTHVVHANASADAAEFAVKLPNLCVDLKAWAASGYKTASPSTTRFVHRIDAISASIKDNVDQFIAHELVPYEDGVDRTLAHRVNHLQARARRLLLAHLLPVASALSLD